MIQHCRYVHYHFPSCGPAPAPVLYLRVHACMRAVRHAQKHTPFPDRLLRTRHHHVLPFTRVCRRMRFTTRFSLFIPRRPSHRVHTSKMCRYLRYAEHQNIDSFQIDVPGRTVIGVCTSRLHFPLLMSRPNVKT